MNNKTNKKINLTIFPNQLKEQKLTKGLKTKNKKNHQLKSQ
jgi:hypothetical protein